MSRRRSDREIDQHLRFARAEMDRRTFLRTAGAATAAAALAEATPAHAAAAAAGGEGLVVDVLVCGGGCAGLAAAINAARSGASTLLVERAGFAGGIITTVGLPFFDGVAEIRENRVLVRGVALELLSRSGVCAPGAKVLKSHYPAVPNIEAFKRLADQMILAEAPRLKVLYHTLVAAARVEEGRIAEVTLANKGGLTRVKPKVVVDCTGDADVAFFAGCPTEKKPEVQPMTLHFRIGNVKPTGETGKLARAALEKANAAGKLPMFYGPGLSFLFAPDEAYIHGIRVPADGSDPADLTRAEIQGRADAWAMFEAWKKEVPGFENAYFMSSGPFIGVRETRRIVGQYVLTEQDITANKKFDDAVATGCWYLDQHPNKVTLGSANEGKKVQPDPYDIPYRSLVATGVDNLLVAGRCHSATQLAASSTRVTATAMALGEAAGVAAGLAVSKSAAPGKMDGADVRAELKRQGRGAVQDQT